jgi:hypothetical protein
MSVNEATTLSTINVILSQVGLASSGQGITVSSLSECSSSMFVAIFEALFRERLEGVVRFPQRRSDLVHNSRQVIDRLAQVLETDLSYISPERLCAGELTDINNLAEIFRELLTIRELKERGESILDSVLGSDEAGSQGSGAAPVTKTPMSPAGRDQSRHRGSSSTNSITLLQGATRTATATTTTTTTTTRTSSSAFAADAATGFGASNTNNNSTNNNNNNINNNKRPSAMSSSSDGRSGSASGERRARWSQDPAETAAALHLGGGGTDAIGERFESFLKRYRLREEGRRERQADEEEDDDVEEEDGEDENDGDHVDGDGDDEHVRNPTKRIRDNRGLAAAVIRRVAAKAPQVLDPRKRLSGKDLSAVAQSLSSEMGSLARRLREDEATLRLREQREYEVLRRTLKNSEVKRRQEDIRARKEFADILSESRALHLDRASQEERLMREALVAQERIARRNLRDEARLAAEDRRKLIEEKAIRRENIANHHHRVLAVLREQAERNRAEHRAAVLAQVKAIETMEKEVRGNLVTKVKEARDKVKVEYTTRPHTSKEAANRVAKLLLDKMV